MATPVTSPGVERTEGGSEPWRRSPHGKRRAQIAEEIGQEPEAENLTGELVRRGARRRVQEPPEAEATEAREEDG